MLRTLPRQRLEELEEQLPAALANTVSTNALECKLNASTYKVGQESKVICIYGTAHMVTLLLNAHLIHVAPTYAACINDFLLWQVSYVIETSDAFLRRNKRQIDMAKRAAERSQKFHKWYNQQDFMMVPAFAAALGFLDHVQQVC